MMPGSYDHCQNIANALAKREKGEEKRLSRDSTSAASKASKSTQGFSINKNQHAFHFITYVCCKKQCLTLYLHLSYVTLEGQ